MCKEINNKNFKKVNNAKFPIIEACLGCRDFINDDLIVGTGKNGNLFYYSISNGTATSKVVDCDSQLMDVTNGPLSGELLISLLDAFCN